MPSFRFKNRNIKAGTSPGRIFASFVEIIIDRLERKGFLMNNKTNSVHDETKHIYALDIGTRSVVGVVLEVTPTPDGPHYRLIGTEMEEHQERSMLDGQIHHVGAVAKVIANVKEKLEKRFGPIKEVAVAAAGRSLKTKRVTFQQEIKETPPLDEDRILAMELSAVQQAQYLLAMENKETEGEGIQYYCVGYSLLSSRIDGMQIGHLLDQRGEMAEVEILATFLPRIVVDNLLAALNRAGLTMSALTLEPIAAIHVLIPPSMRRLNLALVDIGAGTSDIAITDEGTVIAYGMVPVAGDEITDGLARRFLLDFPEAERVKRTLREQEEVAFTDVLGVSYQMKSADILKELEEERERLIQAIGEKIMELNGKPPQAVILIGGGSLLPTLGERLAHFLRIPSQRVAVRGADAIPNIHLRNRKKAGPEMVTPIGIAVAALEHPVRYLNVTVNGESLRLFDLRRLTVGDAAMAAGIELKRLHGKPGLAVSLLLNGRLRLFPGSHGKPPSILQNGEKAGLNSTIKDGDRIEIIPGEDGTVPKLLVKDVIQEIATLDLTLNGKPISFPPDIKVNGKEGDLLSPLKDRDEVEVHLPTHIGDLLPFLVSSRYLTMPLWKEISYTVNGETKKKGIKKTAWRLNGSPADLQTPIHSGAVLEVTQEEVKFTLQDLLSGEEERRLSLHVHFNGEQVEIPLVRREIRINGIKSENLEQEITDGDRITIEEKPLPAPRFHDLFRYVDYTLPSSYSRQRVELLKNGEETTLDQSLHDGDVLEIRFTPVADRAH